MVQRVNLQTKCRCGGTYTRNSKHNHRITARHIRYIINNDCDDLIDDLLSYFIGRNNVFIHRHTTKQIIEAYKLALS